MSYWTRQKPVHRTRSVDVNSVARISVELLDEGGLRALTLRAVAQRAHVAPASLYSRLDSAEDLFDLALDHALAADAAMTTALQSEDIRELMNAFHRHLLTHRWAGQVIGMRAPQGPAYLTLSERMCVLLESRGDEDPLSTAYLLSNFVIGSALTAPVASDERSAPIDFQRAPTYSRLHRDHTVDRAGLVGVGIDALLHTGRQ